MIKVLGGGKVGVGRGTVDGPKRGGVLVAILNEHKEIWGI